MVQIPERARRQLVEAGLVVTAVDGVTVADPGTESPHLLPTTGRTDDRRPIELHTVGERPEPWWVVATLADALRHDRRALFVPDGPDADGILERLLSVLATPTGVASEDADGARTFYTSPDRIHLAGGGLALAESRRPAFTWREETPGDAPTVDGDPRSGADRKRLVLEDGERTVAILDGIDALGCPRPDADEFPYAYRREDGVFAVRSREGRLVGTFAGVRAMRDAGFAPVPAPVIPEFEFQAPPQNAWGVLDPARAVVHGGAGERRID